LPARLGEYRIRRLVARGGMGEVYEAEEERLGRRVAVKVMRRGRVSPLNALRFLREQKVLARLHQTHIVPILAAGESGAWRYFAMPYIEGAALRHVIALAAQARSSSPGGRTPDLAGLAEQAASRGGEVVGSWGGARAA